VQAGRGVKIVIPLALRRKVAKITGKIGCAWGKDFCTLRRDPEKQGVMNTARGSECLQLRCVVREFSGHRSRRQFEPRMKHGLNTDTGQLLEIRV
jgi:hypothetical protein